MSRVVVAEHSANVVPQAWGRRLALTVLAYLASAGVTQAALFDPHWVHSGTLPNGLRVIVEQEKGAPVVAVEVLVKAGVADEPPERGGIAHLLEHVLWATGGEEDPRAEIEAIGGVTNAGTLRDFTHFYATVPAGNLELAVRSLAELVRRDEFDEEAVARERQVILDEAAMRGSDPRAMLSDLAFERVYGTGHPYGRRLGGTEASLAAIDAVKLGAFHRSWYVPNNMAVVVVGDVGFGEAMAVVTAAFGDLVARPIPGRRWPEVARPARGMGARAGSARGEAYVMAAFVGPSILEPTESAATDVLTILLSEASLGRLRKSALGREELAQEMGVDFLTQRDRALLGVWAVCDAASIEPVKTQLQRELTRLAEEPLSPRELMLAKRLTLAAYAFANETPCDRANTLTFYEALGNYREASQYAHRVRALGSAEVQRVARWYAEEPVWILLAAREVGQ